MVQSSWNAESFKGWWEEGGEPECEGLECYAMWYRLFMKGNGERLKTFEHINNKIKFSFYFTLTAL